VTQKTRLSNRPSLILHQLLHANKIKIYSLVDFLQQGLAQSLFLPGAGLVMPGVGYALTAPGIEATGHKVMLVSRRRWIWLAVL
jgi:hypothetical protein